MALLLLALALVATFGGGDVAPDATTAVPVAVCSCPTAAPLPTPPRTAAATTTPAPLLARAYTHLQWLPASAPR